MHVIGFHDEPVLKLSRNLLTGHFVLAHTAAP